MRCVLRRLAWLAGVACCIALASATNPPEAMGLSYADDPAAVERFRAYLRVRTDQPKPDYRAAEAFLLSLAAEMPFLEAKSLVFEAGKPLVVFTWRGTQPGLPSIMFNSHTDVVPAENKFWTHSPFDAAMDDAEDIYARGSQDMKCVGAAQLEALRRLHASGWRPRRTIHATFVPDEEIGGSAGMGAFVRSPEFAAMAVGLSLDEGYASQDPVLPAFYAERSVWWVKLKAHGRPGHGSKLVAHNAMGNLLASLDAVMAFRQQQLELWRTGRAEEGGVTSVNVAYLKGGVPSPGSPAGFVMNMQPAEAEAGLDIRVPPSASMDDLKRRVESDWAPPSRNMSVVYVQQTLTQSATAVDGSDPWWPAFVAAVHKTGLRVRPAIFPAATDGHYLRDAGVACIGFSPLAGTPRLLHEHDERLNAGVYLRMVAVYESLIRDLAGAAEAIESEL